MVPKGGKGGVPPRPAFNMRGPAPPINLRVAIPAQPSVPDDTRDQYKHLREDLIKMEAAATEAEEKGDEGGAKFKMMLAGEMNEKIKELEEAHPGLTMPEPKPVPKGTSPAPPAMAFTPQMMNMMPMFPMPLSVTQQQALQYEHEKLKDVSLDPEIMEFQCQYGLQDRHVRVLNEQLKHRNSSYDDDLWALHEILGKCNNTAQRVDLLNMNVRWMAAGSFCGPYSPNPDVIKAAKKFNLDPPSACKLAEALEDRKDPDDDIRKINLHLERSNKPSSLCMLFLKTLKKGDNLDENFRPAAVGSWFHKQETKKAADARRSRSRGKKDRERERSPRRTNERYEEKRRSRSQRRQRTPDRRQAPRGRDDRPRQPEESQMGGGRAYSRERQPRQGQAEESRRPARSDSRDRRAPRQNEDSYDAGRGRNDTRDW